AEAHGKDTEHIARHLAAGDRAEARALAHALKGAAAAVGLSGPADALAALEADLRGGAPDTQCLAALAALDRALAPVMAAIGALDLNAAAPAVAAGTLDAAAAELLLDRLESRLEAGAYEACDLWTRNAAQLHALLGADARRLEQQIGIFEFEAALATLRAARRPAVRRK
ncbi:MAG: Hpt domain-containing protein, partial [Rhodocyclaceae bacterium]|nr:Hpt domain-containing protein [Rhodocyclaceae bacterium]